MLLRKHRFHQSRYQYGRGKADGSKSQGSCRADQRERLHRLPASWWCFATPRRITPLWPVYAFHGVSEPDCVINVGVSGPGVVRAAVAKFPDYSINDIAELIKKTAFKVTRMGQLVGVEASRRLGVPFGIVDLSLPHPSGRRLRGPYFGRDWPGKVRRRRHHSLPGYAQRCCQERRRDGLLQRRRPVRLPLSRYLRTQV